MSLTETPPGATPSEVSAAAGPASPTRSGQASSVLENWLLTADHKRIGRLYVVGALLFGLGMLVLGALIGIDRMDGTATYLGFDAGPQIQSLWQVGLVFLVVAPLLLGLATAVVPLQVGARGIAFPRAAALSFWTWLIAGGTLVAAYAANGGPGGGKDKAVDLFLLSLVVVVLALLLLAVCLATTVLTLRTGGMSLRRVPFFSYATLTTAIVMLLSLPVLVGLLILLWIDHRYMRATFNGNKGVASYIGWAMRQPQVFLYALPALGILADIVPVMGRTRQQLANLVYAAIGFAGFLSFGAWVQPAFRPEVSTEVTFIVVSVAAAIPVLAIIAFSSSALARRGGGRLQLSAPLLFALGAGIMGLVGGALAALTGLDRLDLIGTTFEQSVYEYALLGLGLLGGLAGLTYWGPKLWGRTLPDGRMKGLAVLGLLGVVLAAAPDAILGFLKNGQPLGELNWDSPDFDLGSIAKPLNIIHGAGAIALAVVLLGVVLLALQGFSSGDVADGDPWDGHTLEWATSSPPPAGNFAGPLAEVTSPQPLLDLKERTVRTAKEGS